MSPTISLSQTFAAALHSQVFVMLCYIDIRNGGLIKAPLLIQKKPEPILWCLPSAPPTSTAVSVHAADIISDHLREAVFAEIEIASLECPDCLQLCRGFHPHLPHLSHPFLCLYGLTQAAFFAQVASSHV